MAVDGGSVKGRDLAGRRPLRLARGLAPLLALARLGLGPARLALGEIVALALGLAEDARLDDGAPEATQHRLEALARLLLHLHGPEDLLTPFAPPGGARLSDSPVAARGRRRATVRPCCHDAARLPLCRAIIAHLAGPDQSPAARAARRLGVSFPGGGP